MHSDPIFSRKPQGRTLLSKLTIIYMVWAAITYVIAISGLWWSCMYIIEKNFIKDATELSPEFAEFGKSIYLQKQGKLPAYVSSQAESHDVGLVRYYGVDGAHLLGEYAEQGFSRPPAPTASQLQSLEHLGYLVVTEHTLGVVESVRIISPIYLSASLRDGAHGGATDSLVGYLDMHMNLAATKGLVNKNMFLVSVLLVYVMLFILMPFGARTIQKAMRPLHDLQIPLRELAQGNFNVQIDDRSGEREIVEIKEALRATITGLQQRDVQMEQALRDKLRAELESQEKGQFIAHMSHEIRTPLNGVLGFLGLMGKTDLNEVQRDYLRTIDVSARTLLTVINDILDFSKIEAGKLSIERIDINLRELMEDSVSLHAINAHDKGLDMILIFGREVPSNLIGDPARIAQVLSNLVNNAIKFTSSGEVLVEANLLEETPSRALLRFRVSDTGIGITEDARERLFQPFSQADDSTTRKFGGTGLGLAICKRLVEMMGGTIGMESVPGKGSAFTFDLPLGKQQAVVAIRADTTKPEILRVLCVTQNARLARALSENMLAWKMDGQIAVSGSEALSVLEKSTSEGMLFDAVVVDHAVADIKSVALSVVIREEKEKYGVPRLVLMMNARERVEEDCPKKKCFAVYLTKPVKSLELYNAVVDACGVYGTEKSDKLVLPADASWPELHILVADDNEINRRLAATLLQQIGAKVDQAADGASAVQASKDKRYDLILMDIHMPVMDGIEAARAIREHQQGAERTPIVALTANAMQGDRERYLAAGMDDYLAKPINETALLEKIVRYCQVEFEASSAPCQEQTGSSYAADDAAGEGVPVIDIQLGIKTAFGDEDTWRMVLDILLKGLPDSLVKLHVSHDWRDLDALHKLAHKMNGSALSCGTPQLQKAAKELETACQDNHPWEQIAILVEALDHAVNCLLQQAAVDGMLLG